MLMGRRTWARERNASAPRRRREAFTHVSPPPPTKPGTTDRAIHRAPERMQGHPRAPVHSALPPPPGVRGGPTGACQPAAVPVVIAAASPAGGGGDYAAGHPRIDA